MQRIGQKVSFNIQEELLRDLDKLAELANVTRADMMRNCLEVGVDMGKGFQRVGFFKIADFVTRAKSTVRRCLA